MDLIFYGSLMLLFLAGACVVLVTASPNNKLRLAAWLEASARQQEEIWACKRAIAEERRVYQRTRELALLRQATNAEKPRSIELASR